MSDIIVPLIIAFIAAVPGIAALIANQRKARAESNSIEVDALRETINSLRTDNTEIRKQLDELETKFHECKEDLEGTIAEQAALNRAFAKLQQEFMEAQRAKELLQQAVTERDNQITLLRARIVELETRLKVLTQKVNGDGTL